MDSLERLDRQGWRTLLGDARCILECGCHDGSDTAMLLEAFPNATIHCWEPDNRPIQRFKKRFANEPRVVLYEAAVSDHEGMVEWFASHGEMKNDPCRSHFPEPMQNDWDASGSIMRPTGHNGNPPWLYFTPDGFVRTTRLDTWYATCPYAMIDLLWADVQGAELKLFAGAKQVLKRTRYLYTEVYDRSLTPHIPGPDRQYDGQPYLRELLGALAGWSLLGFYNLDSLLFRNDLYGHARV